jgi:hypothetical protein
MDRRQYKRSPHFLDANIVSGRNVYDGCIENVSRDGIEYIITSTLQAPAHMIPEKVIDLYLEVPSGEEANLRCEVVWYLKNLPFVCTSKSPKDIKMLLGLKVLYPTSTYCRLIDKIREI